jgi:hypothetical protein
VHAVYIASDGMTMYIDSFNLSIVKVDVVSAMQVFVAANTPISHSNVGLKSYCV